MIIRKVSLEFGGKLTPINKNKIKGIALHHMAHPTWTIEQVHNYHRYSNKWLGIGYNYWIGLDGIIYEARGMHIGGHVRNQGSELIGIGFQGDFQKNNNMTDEQVRSAIELIQWLLPQFPQLSVKDVGGHKDFVATLCPGKYFRMAEIKKGLEVKTIEVPPVARQLYRVRKSWQDARSQLGAFAVLKNAKRLADTNPGYSVFDNRGVSIYPLVTENSHDIYTVVRGDTLWGIAQSNLGSGIRWKEIYDLNNLSSTILQIGQKLKLPQK